MHRTFLIVLLTTTLLASLHAEEVSKIVKRQALALYGEQAKRFYKSEVKQIESRAVSKQLENFCKPYRFFMVGIPVPEAERTSMTQPVAFFTMASADDALPVNDAKEIATFMTRLKKPISNDEEVLARVSLFAELCHASIRTNMPEKESIIRGYMDQKPENWPLVISGTKSGWEAFVVLMTNSDIEYCIRYKLEFSREGKLSVLGEKDIYSYTLYE